MTNFGAVYKVERVVWGKSDGNIKDGHGQDLSAGAYQGINYRHQNSVPWYAGEAKFRTRTTKILLELVRSL